MKLKMHTENGPVIIDSNEVTQFYPNAASGGELTAIETISTTGKKSLVLVKHGLYQVTSALVTAWSVDKSKAKKHEGGA